MGDWGTDEILSWIIGIAKSFDIAIENLQLFRFLSLNGRLLSELSEAEFIANDPIIGRILYSELNRLLRRCSLGRTKLSSSGIGQPTTSASSRPPHRHWVLPRSWVPQLQLPTQCSVSPPPREPNQLAQHGMPHPGIEGVAPWAELQQIPAENLMLIKLEPPDSPRDETFACCLADIQAAGRQSIKPAEHQPTGSKTGMHTVGLSKEESVERQCKNECGEEFSKPVPEKISLSESLHVHVDTGDADIHTSRPPRFPSVPSPCDPQAIVNRMMRLQASVEPGGHRARACKTGIHTAGISEQESAERQCKKECGEESSKPVPEIISLSGSLHVHVDTGDADIHTSRPPRFPSVPSPCDPQAIVNRMMRLQPSIEPGEYQARGCKAGIRTVGLSEVESAERQCNKECALESNKPAPGEISLPSSLSIRVDTGHADIHTSRPPGFPSVPNPCDHQATVNRMMPLPPRRMFSWTPPILTRQTPHLDCDPISTPLLPTSMPKLHNSMIEIKPKKPRRVAPSGLRNGKKSLNPDFCKSLPLKKSKRSYHIILMM